MVIGLDCAEPDLVFNRWLTKSAAYEAGPDKTRAQGLEGLQIKDTETISSGRIRYLFHTKNYIVWAYFLDGNEGVSPVPYEKSGGGVFRRRACAKFLSSNPLHTFLRENI